MAEFKDIVAGLNVKTVHFTPREHDGSLGKGTEYKEHFGPSNYAFEHNGVHFIASVTCSPGRAHRRRPT